MPHLDKQITMEYEGGSEWDFDTACLTDSDAESHTESDSEFSSDSDSECDFEDLAGLTLDDQIIIGLDFGTTVSVYLYRYQEIERRDVR